MALAIGAVCQRLPPFQSPLPLASQAQPSQSLTASARQAAAARQTTPAHASFPLRVAGTGFVDAKGTPFVWRGITAFRLAEMVASGHEQEATAYLQWAQSERLNVVRVLLMARHLFTLTPDAGRKALPRLLDLAKERGIAVEVVTLADTKDVKVDYETHIREVGRIALEKGNAFVEIANEPGHHTQDKRLHDPTFAKRLADLLPADVIVALGSVEYGEGYAAADYATTHLPRGREWDHVLTLRNGAVLVEKLRKPVVSDEPIGAGLEYDEGRRDNEPSRFAAAAALTRLAGMGATFHYEGGLQASIPRGREAACLDAWQTGFALLADVPIEGEFIAGDPVRDLAAGTRARAVFARVSDQRALILLVDPASSEGLKLAAGWTELRRTGAPGILAVLAERSQQR
jgi:hypothetical protein